MIVTIDMETFYDTEYNLTRLSEVEYILSDKFEVIMCAVAIGDDPSRVYIGHDAIAAAFARIDWSRTAVLAHNSRFDASILAWHFGHRPKLYLDTLSMARATTHWHIGSSSLASIARHLGLPAKGDEVIKAKGKRLADFNVDDLHQYARYCARDNELCRAAFEWLRGKFTAREIKLIDLILRMFISPQVELDEDVLEDHLDEVKAEKERLLDQLDGRLETAEALLASNKKFAALLESYGVEVPLKTSPTTGKLIPALARNDWAFKELCQDDEQPPEVQALLAARMGVKSTLSERRTEALLRMQKLAGMAVVPLKYSGARTHRLSGDGKVNFQNFPRGSKLRAALRAPPGYRVVHRDASQIEARMVAWLAQSASLLQAFREGRDVYSWFASVIYQYQVTERDELERFIGKTAILGLGYGCGPARFRHMLYIGSGGISQKVDLSFAEWCVETYRKTFRPVPKLWRTGDSIISAMAYGGAVPPEAARLPIEITDAEKLILPNGLAIVYPNLGHYRSAVDDEEFFAYDNPRGNGLIKIYGAKMVENISQALSRIHVTDAALRVYNQTGCTPWLSTHDSLDYCVPAADAAALDKLLAREFAVVPSWAPGLPLASGGGWGVTLLDAERKVNQ